MSTSAPGRVPAPVPPAPPSSAGLPSPAVLHALADLFAYPDEAGAARARAALKVLSADGPALRAEVEPLARALHAEPEVALEEAYARTFDWNPTGSLDLGWHLFGERYERGAFLAELRGRLRSAGVEEGEELPDHLPTCLRLVARLGREAAPLAREALVPALSRLRLGLKDSTVPWVAALSAAESALRAVGGEPATGGGA